MTKPSTPGQAPYRNPDVSTLSSSQISIILPEVIDQSDEAGGSEIMSYNLEWNEGSGLLSFTEVAGESSDSLVRLFTLDTTPGTSYIFRYKVRNVYGWSDDYSPTVTLLSADVPDAPAMATTEIQGLYVRIAWTEPANNYSPIKAYTVLIMDKF